MHDRGGRPGGGASSTRSTASPITSPVSHWQPARRCCLRCPPPRLRSALLPIVVRLLLSYIARCSAPCCCYCGTR